MKKEYIVELTEEEADELMDEHCVGELVRCKDCRKNMMCELTIDKPKDWFCADGRKVGEAK
jgi:hypothetical protein